MFGSIDRSRAGWWAGALVLAGVLGFVLYAFVGTFVLGVFLYYAARPVHVRMRPRVRSPSVSAGVALLALALPVVLLFGYTVALGLGQLGDLASADLSRYEGLLAPYVDIVGTTEELERVVESLLADPAEFLAGSRPERFLAELAGSITQYFGVVLNGLLHLFIALALAFYLLRDGGRLATWIRATLPDERLVAYGRAVDADLETVFFGNILNALLAGSIGAIAFTALAALAPPSVPVPVPILLGLLAGAGSLVPVVGMKIVYVPVTIYLAGLAALEDPAALWFPVAFFAVALVVVDTIPDLVLRPYVSGRNLHVGAVMFAYIFGPLLFGWYGLFLGPLLLVLVADFARVVLPDLLGSEEGPAPTSLTGEPIADGPGGPPHAPVDGLAGTDGGETTTDGGGARANGDSRSDDRPPASDASPSDRESPNVGDGATGGGRGGRRVATGDESDGGNGPGGAEEDGGAGGAEEDGGAGGAEEDGGMADEHDESS